MRPGPGYLRIEMMAFLETMRMRFWSFGRHHKLGLTPALQDLVDEETSCKLLQCKELHERLDCKTMEIKWYKYIKVSVKRLTSMTYK